MPLMNRVFANRRTSRKSVVVAVDLAKKSRRDFLAGIFDRCNCGFDWSIRILQSSAELTPEIVRGWEVGGVDGVIITEDGVEGTERALAESCIPAVIVGSRRDWLNERKNNMVFLRIDDERLGAFAAEQLSKLGAFNSAAFMPSAPDDFWGELRERGFCAGMRKHKLDVCIYNEKVDGPISEFVERLPKPAAVFAASDKIAFSVISTLRNPETIIPGKVVLLGVDNDELLCNSVKPRLSSVNPDHYDEGRIAQRELESLMRARKPRQVKTILCSKMELVGRESTVNLSPSARILSRALDYISRHAVEGVTPDMVAEHTGISRRLLDLRFNELHSRTVAQCILEAKLDAVKYQLAETETPIGNIAQKCGFINSNHLKNIFRRYVGVSMRAFRKSANGNG